MIPNDAIKNESYDVNKNAYNEFTKPTQTQLNFKPSLIKFR